MQQVPTEFWMWVGQMLLSSTRSSLPDASGMSGGGYGYVPQNLAGRKLLCGGGDGTETHLPNPPLPLLGRRAGRGVWAGAALPAMPGGGGGGPTSTYMAQNDPHVALIILTTHMWGKIFE